LGKPVLKINAFPNLGRACLEKRDLPQVGETRIENRRSSPAWEKYKLKLGRHPQLGER